MAPTPFVMAPTRPGNGVSCWVIIILAIFLMFSSSSSVPIMSLFVSCSSLLFYLSLSPSVIFVVIDVSIFSLFSFLLPQFPSLWFVSLHPLPHRLPPSLHSVSSPSSLCILCLFVSLPPIHPFTLPSLSVKWWATKMVDGREGLEREIGVESYEGGKGRIQRGERMEGNTVGRDEAEKERKMEWGSVQGKRDGFVLNERGKEKEGWKVEWRTGNIKKNICNYEKEKIYVLRSQILTSLQFLPPSLPPSALHNTPSFKLFFPSPSLSLFLSPLIY